MNVDIVHWTSKILDFSKMGAFLYVYAMLLMNI